MSKRITIKEMDRFREKLELAEAPDAYIMEQKQRVVSCLNNICSQLEFREEKSMRIKENKSHKETK